MQNKFSRRHFIKNVSFGAAALAPALSYLSQSSMAKNKLGVALVGLGSYSTYELAPALQETKNCYLAGIVTGTPSRKRPGPINTTSLEKIFTTIRILITSHRILT